MEVLSWFQVGTVSNIDLPPFEVDCPADKDNNGARLLGPQQGMASPDIPVSMKTAYDIFCAVQSNAEAICGKTDLKNEDNFTKKREQSLGANDYDREPGKNDMCVSDNRIALEMEVTEIKKPFGLRHVLFLICAALSGLSIGVLLVYLLRSERKTQQISSF